MKERNYQAEKETTQKIAKTYNTDREAVRKQQKVKQYVPNLNDKSLKLRRELTIVQFYYSKQ
jgi:hypothetical protein